MAAEKAPAGAAAVIVIRPRKGAPGYKYTIPLGSLAKLAEMNKTLDPRGRYDTVMASDDLFQVEPVTLAALIGKPRSHLGWAQSGHRR
jgi:hypothetical protein